MKTILSLLILLSLHSFGQSVEINPSSGQTNGNLKVNKDGIGLVHANGSGTISLGTYASASGAFIQTHTNHPLYFTTNNGSARLTLGTNGFFGIGTTTPQHPLTFPNQLGEKISLWGGNTNATNGHYGMGIQNSLFQIYSAGSADDIAFGHGRSAAFVENVRFKGNGNVGIGVNPAEKLHVNGTIRSTSLAGVGTRPVGTDANGNLVVIQGAGSSSQVAFLGTQLVTNIYDNQHKDLNLSEIYDLSNNLISTVNGSVFTVTSTGIYHFSLDIKWQGNANGYRRIRLEDGNGILIRLFEDFPPNALDFRQTASFDLQLTAGSAVYFQLLQTSGVTLTAGLALEPVAISCFKVN